MSQETTQARSCEIIAKDIQDAVKRRQELLNERRGDLWKYIQNIVRQKRELDAAQEALSLHESNHVATEEIKELDAALEDLKMEAFMAFDADGPRTFKNDTGVGFQYRARVKTVIIDEGVLARSLVENDLWKLAGAKLTVSGTEMKKLMDEGAPVDGVSIEVVPTVAVLLPKEY